MWIKVNNKKFWLIRLLDPVKYNELVGFCRLIIKDKPEDEYTGVLDLGYGIQNYRYTIRLYNPDTGFTVYDYDTFSIAYSAISTRLTLEEL